MTRTPRTDALPTALFVLALALGTLLGAGALALLPRTPVATLAPLSPPEQVTGPCQEGDPCWACGAMGNGVCGPTDATTVRCDWPGTHCVGAHAPTPLPITPRYVG